jgi:hypothetical protein
MSETFLNPVSRIDHPDYYRKIEHPMDLSRVESKLRSGSYESGYDFAMDVRLIWVNSFIYNRNNSELFSHTVELCSYFESQIKGSELLTLVDKKNQVVDLYKKIDKLSKGFKEIQNKGNSRPQVKVEKPMSLLEKKSLCQSIKNLEPKHLKGVLEIVKECMDIKGQELEFDIDKLPPRVSRELDVYVKNCLAGKKKTAEPKVVSEASSSKLKELDSQLEQLVMMTRDSQTNVEPQPSPSESSSSESEVSDMDNIAKDWGPYQRIEDASDHSNGFGSMMDFDKIY